MKKVLTVIALASAMLLTSCGVEGFSEVSEADKTVTIAEAKKKVEDYKVGNGFAFISNSTTSIVTNDIEIKTKNDQKYGLYRDENQYYETYLEATNVNGSYYSHAYHTEEGMTLYFEVIVKTESLNGTMKVCQIFENVKDGKIDDDTWQKNVTVVLLNSSIFNDFSEASSNTITVSKGNKDSYKLATTYKDDMPAELGNVTCDVTSDLVIESTGKVSNGSRTYVGSSDSIKINEEETYSYDYNFTANSINKDEYKQYADLTSVEKTSLTLLLTAVGFND